MVLEEGDLNVEPGADPETTTTAPPPAPPKEQEVIGPAISSSTVSPLDEINRVRELVPDIGKGGKWYDLLYNLLRLASDALSGKGWARALRVKLIHAENFLYPFWEIRRYKAYSLSHPMHNLLVPQNEKVTQGGIWVVELFPPSHFESLRRSLRRRRDWGSRFNHDELYGTSVERVTQGRRQQGFTWSPLGDFQSPSARYRIPDAKTENLPKEFDSIQTTAVQIGPSLTAVIAFIRMSELGQDSLNTVWKGPHEPTFEWRGLRRANVEPRNFAAILATQSERDRLHGLARTWLTGRCPGFFSDTGRLQPVVDFNLFEKCDPHEADGDRDMGEPLRALGMRPGGPFDRYISDQVPGALFVPGESLNRRGHRKLDNCWGVIGSHSVMESSVQSDMYGTKPYQAPTMAFIYDDQIRSFLLQTSILQYTRQLEETASEARDTARQRHREFRPRQLDQLKRELLSNSLDLPVVARDAALLWSGGWRSFSGIDVKAVPVPRMGRDDLSETSVIESMGKTCRKAFKLLQTDDSEYRSVLSTVASLGSSAAAARLSRVALAISVVSLLVSITALLAANGGAGWHAVGSWVSGLFQSQPAPPPGGPAATGG